MKIKNLMLSGALAMSLLAPTIVAPTVANAYTLEESIQIAKDGIDKSFKIVENRGKSFNGIFDIVEVQGIDKNKALTDQPLVIKVKVSSLPISTSKYILSADTAVGTSTTVPSIHGTEVITKPGTYTLTIPKDKLIKRHYSFLRMKMTYVDDVTLKPTSVSHHFGGIIFYNNNYDFAGRVKGENGYTQVVNGKLVGTPPTQQQPSPKPQETPNTQQKPVEKEVLPSTNGGNSGTKNPVQQPNEKVGNDENVIPEKNILYNGVLVSEEELAKIKEEENKENEDVEILYNGKIIKESELEGVKAKEAKEAEKQQKALEAEKKQKEIEKSGIKQLPYLLGGLVVVGLIGWLFVFLAKRKKDNKDIFR